ncbi:hypothetical protein [Pannonibacter phragmitetus]|uniref:hypothetical protein n=1 Tax=Pannonibacter phragmitetus TaxID=121719 RepID=UPI0013CED990|nr:hypothetical protein [Pannonibacter phragmitetus]
MALDDGNKKRTIYASSGLKAASFVDNAAQPGRMVRMRGEEALGSPDQPVSAAVQKGA